MNAISKFLKTNIVGMYLFGIFISLTAAGILWFLPDEDEFFVGEKVKNNSIGGQIKNEETKKTKKEETLSL